MGTKVQDPLPPIVLFFGGSNDGGSRMGLLKADVIEAYGSLLSIVHVDLTGLHWLVYPFKEESLHEILLHHFTRKSMHTVLKWMNSEKFVEDVLKILEERIKSSEEKLPHNWHQYVTLVYLDDSLEPTESPYVQRIFDGWFPNAKFRLFSGYDGSIPIWRDAEVKEISHAKKLTSSEVLEVSPEELPLMFDPLRLGLRDAGVPTVRELVVCSRAELKAKGLTDSDLDELATILGQFGLGYGMTQVQIDGIKLGVPEKTIQFLGEHFG